VYRLFPGGKNTIMQAAVLGEVGCFLAVLTEQLASTDQVEECLTVAIQHSAQFLEQHQALSFMREFEPALIEQLLSFDQLNLVFVTAAEIMRPVLCRFMEDTEALAVGMWVSRLVVSYVAEPSDEFDLCLQEGAGRLVRTFLLPGLSGTPLSTATTRHLPTMSRSL